MYGEISKLVVAVCAGAVLAGCGGGGGDDKKQAGPEATDAATVAALELSNLNQQVGTGQVASIARWTLPIPVKTNGEARAIAALDAIEANLGKTVFDRTSIANVGNSSITRGVIVSVGTACSPAGTPVANNCGNVSLNTAGSCGIAQIASTREITGRLYLNLDSPDPAGCKASNDVTIHEMKHAMGLFAHFDGYGNGPAISALSWRVLRTVYANPLATPKAAVVLAP